MLVVWTAYVCATLAEAPVRSWRNVMPPGMIENLVKDQVIHAQLAKKQSKFNKLR